MKKFMPIITNIMCAFMGFVLTQDSINLYRVGIIVIFLLWIVFQSFYDEKKDK